MDPVLILIPRLDLVHVKTSGPFKGTTTKMGQWTVSWVVIAFNLGFSIYKHGQEQIQFVVKVGSASETSWPQLF